MRQLFSALLGLAAGLIATAANADYNLNYGALTCDGNRALIRFTNLPYGLPPIFPDPPPEIDHGLSELPRVDGNTCTLSDGQEVKVKLGDRQGMAWGACGAAQHGFMSLWVGGRKVISWLQVTDDCDIDDRLGATLILDGSTLSICGADYSTCKDISPLLEQAQPDPVEYPAAGEIRPQLGTMTLPVGENRAFCNGFVTFEDLPHRSEFDALDHAALPDAFYDPGSMEAEPSPRSLSGRLPPFRVGRFAFPKTLRADVPGFVTLTRGILWSIGYFDFDNDGREDLVLRQSGRSGGFYGDIFYLPRGRDRGALAEGVGAFLARPKEPSVKEVWDFLAKFQLYEYTGGFPAFSSQYPKKYTFQNLFRVDDQTLVFATPVSRSTRPTAIIYRPRPGGEADPVCVFQRVEENF